MMDPDRFIEPRDHSCRGVEIDFDRQLTNAITTLAKAGFCHADIASSQVKEVKKLVPGLGPKKIRVLEHAWSTGVLNFETPGLFD